MSERTCIITRTRGPSDMMFRFVVGPDKLLVPDLNNHLPGRGAWLVISRRVLEKAIKCNAFAHSFKQDVHISDDMLDIVEQLLIKSALGSLSLARRGGSVITGALKINKAIRSGNVVMVLYAQEAAEDSRRKIAQAVHAATSQGSAMITVATLFTSEEMSLVFGVNNVIHAAIIQKGLTADGFIKRARQLIAYRDEG
ncbi:MAG: hypothetical protein JSC085_000720 [Candidatus Tokpelaia sp. JSC085]|nr:MAG: hypothetical protein JSC085_000720 [Candidatus Tokpelaia sp. JSC085]